MLADGLPEANLMLHKHIQTHTPLYRWGGNFSLPCACLLQSVAIRFLCPSRLTLKKSLSTQQTQLGSNSIEKTKKISSKSWSTRYVYAAGCMAAHVWDKLTLLCTVLITNGIICITLAAAASVPVFRQLLFRTS